MLKESLSSRATPKSELAHQKITNKKKIEILDEEKNTFKHTRIKPEGQ